MFEIAGVCASRDSWRAVRVGSSEYLERSFEELKKKASAWVFRMVKMGFGLRATAKGAKSPDQASDV